MRTTFMTVLVGLLILSSRSSAQDAFVDDRYTNHWGYRAVTILQQESILEGYPDGYFYGNRPVTRYEVVIAITRFWDRTGAFSEKKEKTAASTLMAVLSPSEPDAPVLKQGESFHDIDLGIWNSGLYARPIELGLLSGFPDGNYRGKRSLTRAEFAAVLARMVERQKKEPKLDIEKVRFSDVDGDEWYFGAVLVAAGTGLMEGYGTGAFQPHKALTRYELAVGLARLHKLCSKETAR